MFQKLKYSLKYLIYNILAYLLADSEGYIKLPVLRGPAKGLYFKFDLLKREESTYFLGKYDIEILNVLEKICMHDWVIWDCGTYLGFYTSFFANKVGVKGCVVAFEPDLTNFKRTKANLILNGFSNFKLLNVAIGKPIGETEFIISDNTNSHIPDMYVGSSYVTYKDNIEDVQNIIRIACHSLDEIISNSDIPNPDLIKIDIEGAEKEALKYTKIISKTVRPLVLLELHNPECDAEAWEYSLRSNYKLFNIPNLRIIDSKSDVNGTLLCVPSEKIYKFEKYINTKTV